MLSQERAPIYEALKEYRAKRIVPFDVPGHKMGRGQPRTDGIFRQRMYDGGRELVKAAR